jgi:hypothetical protein
MADAGLDLTEARYDYTDDLDLDHLIGGVYSALPTQRLPPPDQRTAFADQIRRAVARTDRSPSPSACGCCSADGRSREDPIMTDAPAPHPQPPQRLVRSW